MERESAPVFADRRDAGRRLGRRLLRELGAEQDTLVLALPRGGVPVAVDVAAALRAPLDVLLVRKLGVPLQPELAMGAVAEGGIRYLRRDILRRARVTQEQLAAVLERELAELERRADRYRGGRVPVSPAGRRVVVVDDGIATGATAVVACRAAAALGARSVVLAAPVAAPEAVRALRSHVAVVVLEQPRRFGGVGRWYERFPQVPDEEVLQCLAGAAGGPGPGRP